MYYEQLILFIHVLKLSSCDWISEWMSPVQEQLKETQNRRSNDDFGVAIFDNENLRMVRVHDSNEHTASQTLKNYEPYSESTSNSLKVKLEDTLQSAKILSENLKMQIKEVTSQENTLKDAIVNGRNGITTVVVTSLDRLPRTYIVRDGYWTLCRGVIQYPAQAQGNNQLREGMFIPRCIGQEVPTQQDPCVFNSLIKYETVPLVRKPEYVEDDFLCLKRTLNSTLERYLSVPRSVMNETCQNGIVRSLEENVAKCGLRIMSEYTYYPPQWVSSSAVPLDYCAEPDGSCKFIIAWHVSNATIENFEFLKNEQEFKKYFIKPTGVIEPIL